MAGYGFKLRFPSEQALTDALAPEGESTFGVVNARRAYVAVPSVRHSGRGRAVGGGRGRSPRETMFGVGRSDDADASFEIWAGDEAGQVEPDEETFDLEEAEAAQRYRSFIEDYGAVLVPDFQYDLEDGAADGEPISEAEVVAGLQQILHSLVLDDAERATGSSATIAIVDTGVDPARALIDQGRMGQVWTWSRERPGWQDAQGHGSRTARIACGADGVAPGARVISCRTRFRDSELALIYDFLRTEVLPTLDGPLIVNNSFGIQVGTPPVPDPHGDFEPALREAIEAGMVVVFSAGNYHRLAGGEPQQCDPTSIWSYKCRAEVLTVGALDRESRVYDTSSRGPGQFPDLPTSGPKPDFSAFVPDARWGTSGAAPQAAGVAALVLGARSALTSEDVKGHLRGSVRLLDASPPCVGAGALDGAAALRSALDV